MGVGILVLAGWVLVILPPHIASIILITIGGLVAIIILALILLILYVAWLQTKYDDAKEENLGARLW